MTRLQSKVFPPNSPPDTTDLQHRKLCYSAAVSSAPGSAFRSQSAFFSLDPRSLEHLILLGRGLLRPGNTIGFFRRRPASTTHDRRGLMRSSACRSSRPRPSRGHERRRPTPECPMPILPQRTKPGALDPRLPQGREYGLAACLVPFLYTRPTLNSLGTDLC